MVAVSNLVNPVGWRFDALFFAYWSRGRFRAAV